MEKPTGVEECLLLLDIAHHVRQLLTSQTRELIGLTLEQAVVLCCIEKHHSTVTIADIAETVSRTSHTVTGTINVLEKRGLVSRSRNSGGDRRRVLVSLTKEGYSRLEAYRGAASIIMQPLLLASGRADAEQRFSEAIATLSALLPRE